MANPLKPKIKKALEGAGWSVYSLVVVVPAAISDLMAIKDGRCVFIEVKYGKDSLTPKQVFRLAGIRRQGFEVIVAKDMDCIKHLL